MMQTLMSNRYWWLVGIATLVIVLSGAHWSHAEEDGGYPGAFLLLDIDARGAAMGGALTAVADDASGYHYNPAGAAFVTTQKVTLSYRTMSFDRRYGSASLLWPLEGEAAIVGSWVHAGVGDIILRDNAGNRGEEVSESHNSVSFTFAKAFSPLLSIGGTLRYVQMDIINLNAYTVGFDVGGMLALPTERFSFGGPQGVSNVRIGVAIERINYKYPWETGDYWVREDEAGRSFEERWPLNVRGGISATAIEGRVLGAFDVAVNEDSGTRIHAGVEVVPIPSLALRAGLNGDQFSGGAGFAIPLHKSNLMVNYAYMMTDDILDDEHLFTLGFTFE